MRYVIKDQLNDRWAVNTPIEGWIFTILQSAATRFDTSEKARIAIREHYGDTKGRLVVEAVKE